MIRVQYIGQKALKVDNVANTPTVWHGFGDIQTVTPEVWAKLKVHQTIWREAPQAAPQSLASAQVVAQALASSTEPVSAQQAAAPAPVAPPVAPAQQTGQVAGGEPPPPEQTSADAGQVQTDPPPPPDPKYVLVLSQDGKDTPVVLDNMELDALKAFNTQHKLGVDNRVKDPQRFRELLFAAATAEA